MHVHLPKPLHGWRAFAGEVGIIVLGVLIALGAEQLVQAIHNNGVRHEARENILDEIGQNLDTMRRRSATQPCIDKRLDELQSLIDKAAGGVALPRPLWVGRPQVWDMNSERWRSASASGLTSLFSPQEQFGYATMYLRFGTMLDAEAIEQPAWAHLRELEALPNMDKAAIEPMERALQEARYANWRIKVATRQAFLLANQKGFRAKDLAQQPGSRSVCVPLHTDRQTALRMLSRGRNQWIWEP